MGVGARDDAEGTPFLTQTPATNSRSGFSLVELMFAMTITLGIGLIVFHMFLQNENVFRDQTLLLEMQQSARAVASMIADDVRLAGQGVPVYAAAQDSDFTPEAVQTFLEGTNCNTLRFRAGVRNTATTPTVPLTYRANTSTTITVADVSAIHKIVRTRTGRFVYLWGAVGNTWTWVRAEITSINPGKNQITVIPSHISPRGGRFDSAPRIALEEGIAYTLSGGAIIRSTSDDFSSLTSPTWNNQTVGNNFTKLEFTYYDDAGNTVNPQTLALRSKMRRVDFVISAESSDERTRGPKGSYTVSLSVYPRNLALTGH